MKSKPWLVSLHGGHSGEFCDHGKGTLREIIEAAAAQGFHVYGVTEHAPRFEERYLYPEEKALGWDVDKIVRDFDLYARELERLSAEFAGRLNILRGFEVEIVPWGRYAEVMKRLREQYHFDYMVGSVHWVDDIIIDYNTDEYNRAAAGRGGIEPLAVQYYALVGEMIESLEPEVVGHFDIVRRYADSQSAAETPRVRKAAERALDVVRNHDCILDINTARRPGAPYPAPWLIQAARDRGIPMCFGDDSHSPEGVGAGIAVTRKILLENGVVSMTVLKREHDGLRREEIPLE